MAQAKSDEKRGSGNAELKQRLLFVLLALIVYRIGCYIPVPGVDPARMLEPLLEAALANALQ